MKMWDHLFEMQEKRNHCQEENNKGGTQFMQVGSSTTFKRRQDWTGQDDDDQFIKTNGSSFHSHEMGEFPSQGGETTGRCG